MTSLDDLNHREKGKPLTHLGYLGDFYLWTLPWFIVTTMTKGKAWPSWVPSLLGVTLILKQVKSEKKKKGGGVLSLSANRKSKQQMLSKWVRGLQKAQILTLPLEAPASQNYSPGGRTNSHPIFYAQWADCLKCYRRKEGRDSSSSPWSGQSRKAPRRPGLESLESRERQGSHSTQN